MSYSSGNDAFFPHYVIVDHLGMNRCRQLQIYKNRKSKTQTEISVNIPMTNAFARMPDMEIPLENFRTIYTYMLGEKAFPMLNTSSTKTGTQNVDQTYRESVREIGLHFKNVIIS